MDEVTKREKIKLIDLRAMQSSSQFRDHLVATYGLYVAVCGCLWVMSE